MLLDAVGWEVSLSFLGMMGGPGPGLGSLSMIAS